MLDEGYVKYVTKEERAKIASLKKHKETCFKNKLKRKNKNRK